MTDRWASVRRSAIANCDRGRRARHCARDRTGTRNGSVQVPSRHCRRTSTSGPRRPPIFRVSRLVSLRPPTSIPVLRRSPVPAWLPSASTACGGPTVPSPRAGPGPAGLVPRLQGSRRRPGQRRGTGRAGRRRQPRSCRCREAGRCNDSTGHCIDDTRRAGIIRRPGPRTGPRPDQHDDTVERGRPGQGLCRACHVVTRQPLTRRAEYGATAIPVTESNPCFRAPAQRPADLAQTSADPSGCPAEPE